MLLKYIAPDAANAADESIRSRRDATRLQAYRRMQTHSTDTLDIDFLRLIAPACGRLSGTLKICHVRYRAINGLGSIPDRGVSHCRVRAIRTARRRGLPLRDPMLEIDPVARRHAK